MSMNGRLGLIRCNVSLYPAGVYFVRLAGEAIMRSFVIIR